MPAIAPRSSFKTFVRDANWNGFLVLPENRSGVRALRRLVGVTLNGKRSSFCPLVLHGPPGTGKTHLTSTALKVIARDVGGITARSVSAGDLSRPGGEEGFADRGLQTCDFLVLEDIQHLSSRASDAACDLIDYRAARRKTFVVTANSGPAGLFHLPRRLTSRLSSGLVVQLNHQGIRSRRIILKAAAKSSKTAFSPDALEWLIEQSDGLRAALGLLQNLTQIAPKFPGPLERKIIEQILTERGQSNWARNDPQQIVKRVAIAFNITEKELLGDCRLRNVLLPRQVAMYLMRELTKLSLPRIGAFFAGRDHTTVLHACRKVEAEMEINIRLSSTVHQVKRELS
jgi:chromosomal replication initiator protein